MNERAALAIIDRDHGSLEDFVIAILGDKRDALDETLPLAKRADIAGLPLPVFARVISSPQFRALLRVDLVNMAFGIRNEQKHIEKVASVACGDLRLTMSPSGKLAEVDQSPTDVIAAGKYLNELRGTPIEKTTQSAPSVIINIGRVEEQDASTPTITVEAGDVPYRPQRAGGLPPPGVRGVAQAPRLGGTTKEPGVDSELGHLYGSNAEEADEDHALAQKRRVNQTEEDRGRDESTELARPVHYGKFRIWGRNWPGRGEVPERAYPRVTVDD